ncbi:serine hydrolase domain-containing protein [Mesorhizobium sp. 128a]
MTELELRAHEGNVKAERLSTGMLEFDGQRYLDGRASDPSELGWMQGAPPPVDKRVAFEGDKFFEFPQVRWSLSHMRELTPTVNVRRRRGGPSPLDRSDKFTDLGAVTFADQDARTWRIDDALFDTYTDGILVLHRGRVVYERYFGALEPHLPHACHSVTKSYAGTMTAAFVHEGVLDDAMTIAHYLPELRRSAFEDATLRQVMDMETSLAHTEEYSDKHSGVWAYARACGWRSRPYDYDGPRTMCDYLRTVKKEGAHGGSSDYKTINTEVMTWVMARVTGRSFAQLLHERLWLPIGCEEDGYVVVDSAGMPLAGSGLSATLRDVARFGELMRREGEWDGKQVIPASAVHDLQRDNLPKLPGGWSYRSQWWVPHDEMGALEARGIHGQRLYIAPKAEMVIAHFGSHPVASAAAQESIMTPLMLSLGRILRA